MQCCKYFSETIENDMTFDICMVEYVYLLCGGAHMLVRKVKIVL